MSGKDSLKGLISLSLHIDFNKKINSNEKLIILQDFGFEPLYNDDLKEERSKYNLNDIVFTNDGYLYYRYKFRDSESYVILQLIEKDVVGSRAFVVIRQDQNILEIPGDFLKECNLSWFKRSISIFGKKTFKIKLKSKQNVQGYIAVDNSTLFPAIFPLKYNPSKVHWIRGCAILAGWMFLFIVVEKLKEAPNFQILKSMSTLVHTMMTMIFTYLIKDDLDAFFANIRDRQNNKLTLTGLAMSETVSRNATEISAQVEEVNAEANNLQPIND